MSEEELFAGLSLASTLVEQGVLSRNRRAIIKELVLRWDARVMRAIRQHGGGNDGELGQELGHCARKEIEQIVENTGLVRAGESLGLSSLALALQNIDLPLHATCCVLENGAGEISIAASMLEDFTRVYCILKPSERNESFDPHELVSHFEGELRPMLDSGVANSFKLGVLKGTWETNKAWSTTNLVIVSLPQTDIKMFKTELKMMCPGSYLIVLGDAALGLELAGFQILYTWGEGKEGVPPAVVYFFEGTMATKFEPGVSTEPVFVASTPPLRAAEPSGAQIPSDYLSSPLGSRLVGRKHTFRPSNALLDTDEDSEDGDDLVSSSPHDARLLHRKRVHSTNQRNEGTAEAQEGAIRIPNKKKINTDFRGPGGALANDPESVSSPIGASLVNRKRQISKDGPRPRLSLSATPPQSSLSPLQRRLFSQEHYNASKVKNAGASAPPPPSSPFGDALLQRRRRTDKGIAVPPNAPALDNGVSSPMSGSLLRRKQRHSATERGREVFAEDCGMPADSVSSPMSGRLLRRKMQIAKETRGSTVSKTNVDEFQFLDESVSSPHASRLLGRKHANYNSGPFF